MLKGIKKIVGNFYDPTTVLSYMESGDRFCAMVVGSRSIGKSTSWAAALILDYIQRGSRWVYIRGGQGSKDAIDRTAPDFFDTAAQIMRDAGYDVPAITYKAGVYYWGDGDASAVCGYAIPLISAQKYKSVVLSTKQNPVRWMLVDECISEDNRYLSDEGGRLQRLFVTLSRYQGCPYNDDLKLILLANNVSSIGNPYYTMLGADRYVGRDDARIIAPRGAWWCLQYVGADEVTATKDARKSHSYMIADAAYKRQAFENVASGRDDFIGKYTGPQTPLFDFAFDGKIFSAWAVIGKKSDNLAFDFYIRPGACTTSTHYAITLEDHTPCTDFLRIAKGSAYVVALSNAYNSGRVLFYDRAGRYALDYWMNYI